MRLRGLLCRLAATDPEHLETISWSGTPHDLADVRAAGVYLVPSSTLDAIRRRFRDIFNDRGTKHERRALSAILLKQPRVPLAQAEFASLASLRKSVRTLLVNAGVATWWGWQFATERRAQQQATALATDLDRYLRETLYTQLSAPQKQAIETISRTHTLSSPSKRFP